MNSGRGCKGVDGRGLDRLDGIGCGVVALGLRSSGSLGSARRDRRARVRRGRAGPFQPRNCPHTMKSKMLRNALAIAVSTWGAEYVLDRWVIRSDSGDPDGLIVQSEGFGLDDIVRLATYGLVGAFAVSMFSKGRMAL